MGAVQAGPRVPESWRSRAARWIANCAPAYRGCGARVTAIRDDFREVHVRLPLSWRTRNHVGLIWGGSLYAAIDPVLGVMLRVLLGPGHYVVDRAATIAFLRPARGEVTGRFVIDDEEVAAIRALLTEQAKVDRHYVVELRDREGKVCVRCEKVVHIRRS
ncbi:MAG: DUF4442 domain-containing protein [Deltaproteobacteria bacterium]|nr:DUF4442 domain-containing protein [Deltaproteobacteria bacterium]